MFDLKRRVRKKFDEYQRTKDTQPARMGLDDGTVAVSGEKFMVWVKFFDGTILKVLNQRVTNGFGKMVLVGYDAVQFPLRMQVLGSWDVYPEAQWSGSPNHAEQHGWTGEDTVYLNREQFYPGLVVPVSGSLAVDVYPFSRQSTTGWTVVSEVTRFSVSAGVPTTSGFRYSLIVLDDSGALALRNGTVVTSRMELNAGLVPLPLDGDTTLAALVLYTGQTELVKKDQASDILDLRFLGAAGRAPDLGLYVKKDGSTAFTAVQAGVDPTLAAHLATKNYVDGNFALTVKEEDGTPAVESVKEIRVTNGTLTDVGSGVVSLDFGSAATDGAAIHDNVAGEIDLIAEKTGLVGDDVLILEDSEASWEKKKAKVSSLTAASGWTQVVNETFDSLAAWTQVRGTWSVAGNVLSKTNTGFADLRLDTHVYDLASCIIQVDVRFPTESTVATNMGVVNSWDGTSTTGAVWARLNRNSTVGGWNFEFERASVAAWTAKAITSPAFVANTWYTVMVDFTGFYFTGYLNGTRFTSANPTDSNATQDSKYIGLRVGDGTGIAVDYRNFKVWVRNDIP